MCLDYQSPLKEWVHNEKAWNNVPKAWCTQCIFDQKNSSVVVSGACLYNLGNHINVIYFLNVGKIDLYCQLLRNFLFQETSIMFCNEYLWKRVSTKIVFLFWSSGCKKMCWLSQGFLSMNSQSPTQVFEKRNILSSVPFKKKWNLAFYHCG